MFFYSDSFNFRLIVLDCCPGDFVTISLLRFFVWIIVTIFPSTPTIIVLCIRGWDRSVYIWIIVTILSAIPGILTFVSAFVVYAFTVTFVILHSNFCPGNFVNISRL